jgi:signal transduction histidine kinase
MGILRLNYSQVDIQKLIMDIYKYVKLDAVKNGQNIEVEISQHLPCIRCDEDRIKQSLLNLIYNAFKFTSKGGNILIEASKYKDGIIISVKDDGCGMNSKELKNLFKSYKRLDNKRAKLSGLGIGLSIVKQTIDLHNGKIWVKSYKNQGSNFSFYIPANSDTSSDEMEHEIENSLN